MPGTVPGAEQTAKLIHQNRTGRLQLLESLGDRPLQSVQAFGRQLYKDIPAAGAAFAFDESIASGAVDEFDGAVMAHPQASCECSDGRFSVAGKAPDGQHQLILPRLNSRRSGGMVAEIQIVVNALPELRQCAVFRLLNPRFLLRAPALNRHAIS
jgi:hypothetical protein